MGSWNLEAGLNHVGAYQVSGRPYASASINCKEDHVPLTECTVEFPYVTKWFKVINNDESNACRVGFSISGVTGSNNYFLVGAADLAGGHGPTDSGVLELKVSSIVLSGSTDVDIIAGLTTISSGRTATSSGANWSGSSGVG